MFFKYTYPAGHQLEKLNEYFHSFIENIREVKSTAKFSNKYFQQEFLVVLNRSPELKIKFNNFFDNFKILPDADKKTFFEVYTKSQDIPTYFLDISIACLDFRSKAIKTLIGNDSLRILLDHLFKTTLRAFDIEGHYKLIFNAMPYKICPFCGIETMHKSFREDYDHLAAKSLYIFLAINPKNLAPTCHPCNSKNKGEKDLLYRKTSRVKMIYPYSEMLNIAFDYEGSIIPQTDKNNQSGVWKINISPNDITTQNWNDVYGIKKRYVEDYIEPGFEDWIDDFVTDCFSAGKDLTKLEIIIAELKMLSDAFNRRRFQHHNIIKGPLFEYLSKCNNPSFYNSITEKFNKFKLPAA